MFPTEIMWKTLRTFYKFEARRKWLFAMSIFFIVSSSLLGSVLPYFYKLLVEALSANDSSIVIKLIFGFVGVRVGALILLSGYYILGDMVSFDGAINARLSVFKRIQELDFVFHSKKSTGSLISAMKRGDGAYFSIGHVIHHNLIETFITFLVMAYIFSSLDLKISAVVLISFVINMVLTKFIVDLNVRARINFNKEEDKISAIIVDNIINYETVKLFSKENWEYERLKGAFVPWKKAIWKFANSFRVIDQSVGGLVNISILVILLLAFNLYGEGKLGLGDFVLVLGFVNAFFPKLFDLIYSYREIAKNFTDIEKYFKILDYEIKIKDPTDPADLVSLKGEIDFKNVSFNYGERKNRALHGIDLNIRAGQSVALVGRSGSGKTTFAKLLMRFYDPNSGSITIDDIDIKEFTKSRLRSFMGVVPQEPILFNNTLGYNIAYGKEGATQKEIVAASKIAKIDDFISNLPKKYETQVGERGIKLSGGQKQRIAIARMILSDPGIIIFDEATSHLDSESERLIQEGFWKAASGKTTIIIAHRLSTVMRADKIVVLDKGKIVEVGTHMDLVEKNEGLYKKFWDLQIKLDK